MFRRVFKDLEKLVKTHPHIVVDEALHKREIRQELYREARRIADDFIIIWVQANKDIIRQRLSGQERIGHILDDPMPLHDAFARQFEDYRRCVIDCPNNGSADEAIGDLVHLIEAIGGLTSLKPKPA